MITFDELSQAVYEDLEGEVLSVTKDGQALRIIFECDDWRNHKGRSRFELLCDGVAESTATPSQSGTVHLSEEDPLLWQHNEENVSLFFSSAPSEPFELLGRLYDAHVRLFGGWSQWSASREFRDYWHADADLLRAGNGRLAEGPKCVIDEYVKVIGNRLRYSIVHGYTPSQAHRVLLFSECYVVCRSVAVTECAVP
jgi:hypothetical protein